MKRIKDLKIGFRLNLMLSSVFVVIVVAVGIYIISNQKKRIIADTDIRMFEQVNELTEVVKNQIKANQKELKSVSSLAYDLFEKEVKLSFSDEHQKINIQNQTNNQVLNIDFKSLSANNEPLYNNFDFVDKVYSQTKANSTIFQKIPQGYLRISTNIESEGKRAVNTFIPNSSPVVQAIETGSDYEGKAIVVNEMYLTVYKPLFVDGEVQGIFSVAVPEKDMGEIASLFASKHYFESGYPFVLDKEGTFVVHPNRVGESIANSDLHNQMLPHLGKDEKLQYMWEGKSKFQYMNFVEEIDSWVSVSIYENELYQLINQTRLAIIIALVIGFVIFFTVNKLISSSISSSLNKGVLFANEIANGDLTTSLELDQEDEVGQLAKALSKMHAHLKNIIANIATGADNIASASQQISSGSQQLSQGATEQSASVEEISSSMEEMASNIEQNNQNAQVTEKIAIEVQVGVNEVAAGAQKATEVNKMVAEKIQIINDIAFQTNLLALNAAVEAARAGEQGRGFAVVAAEVRKLAERSKVAAEEIVGLANESYKLAEAAGKRMMEVMPSIEKTTKLVQEITASSNEQTSGTEQINSAVQQLNDVTQQNAAASEELATSSEELASQADQLKEVTLYFTLDDGRRSTKRSVKNDKPAAKKMQSSKHQSSKRENIGSASNVKIDMGDSDYESF